MEKIFFIDTGIANTASIKASFERLGCAMQVAKTPEDVSGAAYLVLPGVGAFGAAMKRLSQDALITPLRERILEGKATLAICLGLQLLFLESEESPNARGLAIIPEKITRFPSSLRVPQCGWNRVSDAYAYFANSYRATRAPQDWNITWSAYGDPFIAMMKKQRVLATQFHPELSGDFGRALLKNWLAEEVC